MNNLEICNLGFCYPDLKESIIDNYSYTFSNGTNIMLVGDNGTGKSTIGKLICGLIRPSSGNIRICSQEIFYQKSHQRINLAYYITQINQLQFIRNTMRGEIRFAEKIATKNLDMATYQFFSLPEDLDYNPFELNINEAWRFSLLISTIVNPFVLFVDEIPSGCNMLNKKALSFILNKRKASNQITIVAYQRSIEFPFDKSFSLDLGRAKIHEMKRNVPTFITFNWQMNFSH